MTMTTRGTTTTTGRWTVTPPPCLRQHDNEEGDGHNDETATRARATMRGTGKDEGHDDGSDPTTTTLHHEGEGDNRDNNDN